MKILNFIALSFSILLLLSCSSNQVKKHENTKTKSITIFSGCSDGSEIISDIEQSIESNKSFFEQNQIKIVTDTLQNKCGYLLKWDKNEKEIQSVQTDIDLYNTAKQFFEIK